MLSNSPIVFSILLWIFSLDANYLQGQELEEEILHNSMLAIESGQPESLLQHWFLYQSLQPSAQKPENLARLRSLLWAAIDRLDLCPETLPPDEDGFKIWPMVAYNYLARHSKSPEAKDPKESNTLTSFERGQGMRLVSYDDTLSAKELLSLRSYRDSCTSLTYWSRPSPWSLFAKPKRLSPQQRAELMLRFITFVESNSIFQGDRHWLSMRRLALELYTSEQKDQLLPSSVPLIRELMQADPQFLRLLEPDLRLYLFQLSQRLPEEDPDRTEQTLLRWLDLAAELEESTLLDTVIKAIIDYDPDTKLRIWQKERGLRLIQLAEREVFVEGRTIAMTRALEAYDQKDMIEALAMLAKAYKLAPQSRAEQSDRLPLEWIRHILIEHRFDQRMLNFLETYLPKSALRSMMQDMVWTSSLMGEPQVLRFESYSAYLNQRLRVQHIFLDDIARRRFDSFRQRFQSSMREDPRRTLAFAEELVQRCQHEPYPVIEALLPLLRSVQSILERSVQEKKLRGESPNKVLALYDGLLQNESKASLAQADRGVGRPQAIGLGAIRIPPSRAIPWMFPELPLVSINVFQEIPYRLDHAHRDQTLEIRWHLGPH